MFGPRPCADVCGVTGTSGEEAGSSYEHGRGWWKGRWYILGELGTGSSLAEWGEEVHVS
jgi:hypothetical protein